MKQLYRNQRGQFLVIAAFLVLIILSASIVTIYSRVQDNPFTEPVALANQLTEINLSIKRILGFTVGYYGSILQVTGNVTYAQEKIIDYIYSGLTNLAHSHAEWSPSFDVHELEIGTEWFDLTSWSSGNISITYSLPSLGLSGIKYATSCRLNVEIVDTIDNLSIVNVQKENGYPDLQLTKENFQFYIYNNETHQWQMVSPTIEPIVSVTGNYSIQIPASVATDVYFLQVVDNRGIMTSAFFSPSGKNEYSYNFNWDSTYYAGLSSDTIVAELLQNGTLRWLGESLNIGTETPLPPLLTSAIKVNQTINGINQEVPFQIEEWGSDYSVPLGLTSNASILSSRSIIVFLLTSEVSKTTLWWDGRDTVTQTSFAWTNVYFQADDPDNDELSNGIVTLDLSDPSKVTATVNGVTSSSEFLRINGREPVYGSALSYTIHHGIVRDVIQQEPEYSGGIADSPNVYAHIVITLPANTNYYTFSLRTIFLNTTRDRDLTDLSVLQLYADRGEALTEDGTTGGHSQAGTSPPTVFYAGGTAWAHHWSEYLATNDKGAGLMVRDDTNARLYAFDSIVGDNTGAIEIDEGARKIEFNPIARFPVNDVQDAYDFSWHGAVATFGSGNPDDTIFPYESGYSYDYDNDGPFLGLWVLVEYPPIVTFT